MCSVTYSTATKGSSDSSASTRNLTLHHIGNTPTSANTLYTQQNPRRGYVATSGSFVTAAVNGTLLAEVLRFFRRFTECPKVNGPNGCVVACYSTFKTSIRPGVLGCIDASCSASTAARPCPNPSNLLMNLNLLAGTPNLESRILRLPSESSTTFNMLSVAISDVAANLTAAGGVQYPRDTKWRHAEIRVLTAQQKYKRPVRPRAHLASDGGHFVASTTLGTAPV